LLQEKALYKNKNISLLIQGAIVAVIVITCSYCANPVPPMGGDKDTLKPTLISVTNRPKENQQIIRLEFSENIQTKNALVVSPIVNSMKEQTTTTNERQKIQISTPKITSAIYLNGFVFDLNENNAIDQPTVLLKNDTGELIISTSLDDANSLPGSNDKAKTKKRVFIRDVNRYQLQGKQTDSSPTYLPFTADNTTYHFHGLTDSLHIVYVVYEDNDYVISDYEKATCFYLTNNYRDTFKSTNAYKTKSYKSALNYHDSLYIITEPTLDIDWFNNDIVHQFNKDTLIVLHKNIKQIKDALMIDSFTKIKKLNYSISNEINSYTINNSSDTVPVQLFHHYPLKINSESNTTNYPSTIKPRSKAGRINITNPNTFTIHITINIGSSRFYISIAENQAEYFYLPEGAYSYTCWIAGGSPIKSLSPHTIDYKNQIPLTDADYVYKPLKQIVVSSKLENTLILPDISAFNTGTTSK